MTQTRPITIKTKKKRKFEKPGNPTVWKFWREAQSTVLDFKLYQSSPLKIDLVLKVELRNLRGDKDGSEFIIAITNRTLPTDKGESSDIITAQLSTE